MAMVGLEPPYATPLKPTALPPDHHTMAVLIHGI